MERLLQYIFDGLSFGAIYALVALGLVVVFRGTGHLNFAQGEMAMFCTFIIWQINAWGVPLILAVIIGMVFGFVLNHDFEFLLNFTNVRNVIFFLCLLIFELITQKYNEHIIWF
jgi:branched-chain amino acid transport system permease protein